MNPKCSHNGPKSYTKEHENIAKLSSDVPFPSPRMSEKMGRRPSTFKMNHENELTHVGWRSITSTPLWSIDRKRGVRGKGSFTKVTNVNINH